MYYCINPSLPLSLGLINKLAEAELQIDGLLDKLKAQQPADVEMTPGTKDYITMMSSLNGMLEELRQQQSQFDAFWGVHKARVDHMMRMCHFNRGAEKVCDTLYMYMHVHVTVHVMYMYMLLYTRLCIMLYVEQCTMNNDI